MTQTPGVKIRASLVQKAIKERKQSLMARARASLGLTEPELSNTNGLTIALKRAAPDEHREPPPRGPKVICYKSKTRSTDSPRSNHAPKKGNKRVELEHRQLESSPNSVMNTRIGEDSFRLYKACLLPNDEIALSSVAHSKLEEMAAHDLMRVAAVVHQLTLQCTTLHKDLEQKARVEAEWTAKNEALECQLSKLKAWSEEAEKALLKSKLEIERVKQHGQDSFEAGRAAGRLEMAESEEFLSAIRQARASGAKDYLTSPTFELVLAGKAAEHEVIGFLRCQSQALELGGFKEGFDLGLLDPAMGGSLEPEEEEEEEVSGGAD